MKRLLIYILVIYLTLVFASAAFAGQLQKGTIKAIDTENRTILFCPAGTEDKITMTVGTTVKLEKFKTDMKVKIFVEEKDGKKLVKGMKPDKRKVIQGC
jgi:Cu/Ag efflux protein CusF